MARVLITGCSSGFGRLAAIELAARGHRVFAGCRDAATAPPFEPAANITVLPLDVTVAAAVDAAVAAVGEQAGGLDVLVNNAGIAQPGALEELAEADLRRVMETNFFGALRLTRAVLPGMRSQGRGRIIMMSSLSALVGLPGEGIYAASKAALEAVAESLRYEVDRFGIQVCVIEPGAFDTGMPARVAAADPGPADSPYAPLLGHLQARAQHLAGGGDDPQRVAELIAALVVTDALQFRYTAGDQAARVVAALRELDAVERADFIHEVNDTGWWSAGADRPGAGR